MISNLKNVNEYLIKRPVRLDDLVGIHQLAKTENDNAGIHNFKLFYETSPQTWTLVANDKNEIIAYDVSNKLPVPNLRHGYQLVVRSDYRSKGVSRLFKTMHYLDDPSLGNATAFSLLRYKFTKFGEKFLGYEGLVPNCQLIKPKAPSACKVQFANNFNIDKLIKYDSSVLGFDRSSFVLEWVIPSKYTCRTVSLIATSNDTICGYGVAREYDGYMCISPLYADDDLIAEWLLYELMVRLEYGERVYIYFNAADRFMNNWVNKLRFEMSACEMRNYIGYTPENDLWNMKKVYAMYDFYPV